MRALVLLAAAGCWTGGEATATEPSLANTDPDAAARPHPGFKLKLERTACMGSCPIYSITIHGDGRVDWTGRGNVLAVGERHGHVTELEISELEHELAKLEFFERDGYGNLPLKSECTTTNGTTTCSMGGSFTVCSDTSHTVISVTRKYKTHTVNNANCSDDDEMAELETLVNRLVNVRAWVGDE